MKYNFTQPLRDIKGNPIVEKEEVLTFGEAIVNTLLAPTQEEQAGQEKVRAYELAKKISGAEGEIDIGLDEVERIKKAIHRAVPLVCGQIITYLESAKAEE